MSGPECSRDSNGGSCNGCSDGMVGSAHIRIGTLLIRLCDPCVSKIFRWWRRDIQKDKLFCIDCNKVCDSFMVHNKIWKEAGYSPRVNSCVSCLEKRLERRLTLDDFTPAPINNTIRWAYELGREEGWLVG